MFESVLEHVQALIERRSQEALRNLDRQVQIEAQWHDHQIIERIEGRGKGLFHV